MSKRLIITEKPRVAEHIAAALDLRPVAQEQGKSFQNDDWVCVAARGHLLRLATPDEMNPQWRRWSLATLPILPATFRLLPYANSTAILQFICQWIQRDEISSLVNACDPGREGELIFREIYQAAGSSKSVDRFWLPTLAAPEIRQEALNPRPGELYDGLFASARTRAKADWLIGINLTRALSVLVQPRQTWTVGRVQTPTLAFLYDRDRRRQGHKETYEYFAELSGQSIPEGLSVVSKLHPKYSHRQLWESESTARQELPEHGTVFADYHIHQESVQPPPPPHLLDLQRQMNQNHGWTAAKTLQVAQTLYEKKRVISYPRTDSRQLPVAQMELFFETAKSLVPQLNTLSPEALTMSDARTHPSFVEQIGADHHAIVPTAPGHRLNNDESSLYNEVLRSFLALWLPPAQVQWHSLQGRCGELWVQTSPKKYLGSEPRHQGFYQIFPHQIPEPPSVAAASLTGVPADIGINSRLLPPPPPYTEATLLSAMERAGSNLDDPEQERALTLAQGLGTAATRHQIIENLKSQGYCTADLGITPKGRYLIETLHRAEVDWICQPKLSAQLEIHLSNIVATPELAESSLTRIGGKLTTAIAALRECPMPPAPPKEAPRPPALDPAATTTTPSTTHAIPETRAQSQGGRKRVGDCPFHGADCAVLAVGSIFICETRMQARIKGTQAEGYFGKTPPTKGSNPQPEAEG